MFLAFDSADYRLSIMISLPVDLTTLFSILCALCSEFSDLVLEIFDLLTGVFDAVENFSREVADQGSEKSR
jgi:hypothetical protein